MEIEKYGIKLVPVELSDASFVIDLRTDIKKSRFISSTDADLQQQIDWIKGYKARESRGEEYYFIGIDENSERFATYRIYNIEPDQAEIGSWITKPGYSKAQNSIKMDIIMKEFVFEVLGFSKLKFEVRRENTSVVRYHKMFGPTIIKETDQDIFFLLSKENFYANRNKFLKSYQ